jgi:LuxR family maltose regulon positive regulatory protein
MSTTILATKLYIAPPRSKIVLRPRLIEQLNEGLSSGRKLTLISAPAGFGKTTLVSEWIASCERQVAWLSLDEGDNDPIRFLTYLVAALQTLALSKVEGIVANIGVGVLGVLQAPQPPPTESILTTLLNEIATIPDNFILVLDDYHIIDSKPVDNALTYLLEHQPPQMHLVIATREDPNLPLARLRVRGQLTELRATDLRFTPSEAAEFLNRVMGLNLSAEDITALETRTEGWIAGLQLAAISMQGHASRDTTSFIKSFTGSHHFVLDYLVEEVLQRQSESVQTFLLHTSILDRMCGPLCDAVLCDSSGSGQETLEQLERANLFIVPLDQERHWYRYHHLFGDLLRQRLSQNLTPGAIAEDHIRASEWYENNDLMLEAFRHAATANDIERAERLMEDKRRPIHHLPGAATAILNWLESLPKTVLDAKPALWWKQASMLLVIGQPMGVEEKLQALEAALASATLPNVEMDDTSRDLIGRIAAARANVAQVEGQTEITLVQARRALEYLHPNNLNDRSMAIRSMGFAYYLQGHLTEASRAYAEALSLGQATGDVINILLASIRLGQIQEERCQLYLAAETYQQVLRLIGDYSPPNSPVAYLGLARIYYEWNDLDAAEQYGEKSLQLARQYDQVIDRLILSEMFLAQMKLARGDVIGAARILSQVEQTVSQRNYSFRLPDIAYAQAMIHIRQGNVDEAAQLAQQYDLPLMRARVLIAQNDPSEALEVLEPQRQQAEAKGAARRQIDVMAVQSIALYAHGAKDKAMQMLGEALALAEPGGYIRLFVDEGEPMRLLILDFRHLHRAEQVFSIEKPARFTNQKILSYTDKLLAAFSQPASISQSEIQNPKSEIYFLSPRELEVLRLIAQGLSNRQISARLFLALDTVKGHNRRIFDKLQVQRRTEAIARAHELGLL